MSRTSCTMLRLKNSSVLMNSTPTTYWNVICLHHTTRLVISSTGLLTGIRILMMAPGSSGTSELNDRPPSLMSG